MSWGMNYLWSLFGMGPRASAVAKIFYAIRFDGLFAYLKARSMPHATAQPWVSGKREDL